jgi:AhpD family alkylhydroperoxidase
MAHEHGQAVVDGLRPLTKALHDEIPDVYAGFRQMHRAAYADGVLPVRLKELIALAIGVSEGCDGCIAFHAQAAARAGASKEECAEALGVAIAMNGGPGTVHAPRAFAAFCEFADAAASAT